MADDATQAVERWLERELGAKVLEIGKQARWRPVWFARVELGGAPRELCVRGDRIDARIGFTLEHEMSLQRLLQERGIPTPRVHGWIDAPRAYAMDAVPGEPHFEGASTDERDRAMDHYMQSLAAIHALDVEPFARAGILRAARPEEAGRVGIATYERAYRATKKQPDALLEFALAWLRRNPPPAPARESVVVWDSGQFHQRAGRIEAVLDLEIGHIGDPMMDLAGFRMRSSVIDFGDFDRLYDAYARHGGVRVDRAAIQHHHFAFTLTNQLAFHAALADPPPGSDYMTNMQWCAETNIYATEALGEMLGVALGEVEMPEPRRTPASVGHAHLVRWLRHFEAADALAQHEVRIAFRLARHLERVHEIGDAVEQANLDDLAELLGRRPRDAFEGEAELERFALADDGRHDAELVRVFHRRARRYGMLLGPAGSAIARHNPIAGFGA